jgi:hypothetical protein
VQSKERAGLQSSIRKISMKPSLVETEMHALLKEKHQLVIKSIVDGEIAKNGVTAPNNDSTEWVQNAINIMDDTISSALEKGGAPMEAEIWRIHAERINKVYQQGGKGRDFKKIAYHPMIMNWAIAFLARTSSSIYQHQKCKARQYLWGVKYRPAMSW